MKTTLTFESGSSEGGTRSQTDLELHLRGPDIAKAAAAMYNAVREKAEGRPKILVSAALPPATEPVTWPEVLALLDEHVGNIADLL